MPKLKDPSQKDSFDDGGTKVQKSKDDIVEEVRD